MKLPSTLRTRQRGAILLAILVLVTLLLFLGYTLWQIWKIVRKIKDTPANVVQQTAGEMLSEFSSNNPNAIISSVITQSIEMVVVQPFESTDYSVRIWRSTNLTTWDIVGTNVVGNTWTDTNAPWPNGFYHREIIK